MGSICYSFSDLIVAVTFTVAVKLWSTVGFLQGCFRDRRL